MLDGRARAAPALLAVNLWVAVALGLSEPWAVALMMPAVGVSAWALLTDVPAPSRGLGAFASRLTAAPGQLLDTAVRRLPAVDRVALSVLYRQNRSTVLGTFFGCLLVTFAARGLMSIWAFDGRCLPMAMIALGILALTASGLYQPLQLGHEAARRYTAALPFKPRWLVRADATAIVCFALPFVAALATSLWVDAHVPGPLVAAAVGSFVLLVVLLRATQLFSRRHAVLSSTTLAVGWTYVAATLLQT